MRRAKIVATLGPATESYEMIRAIIDAGVDVARLNLSHGSYAEHEGQTVLKVIDGQHTAIACASHPSIELIPVMIVEAADTAVQAAAFVGQNTERLGVTALQIHRAAVVASVIAAPPHK